VIKSGAELERRYSAAFREQGGDPDTCEGVLWARSIVAEREVTAEEVFDLIASKIAGRTADHGWLIGILRHLWAELSEKQRIQLMTLMGDHVAKSLLAKRIFNVEFTKKEKEFLIGAMTRAKCPGAVRLLGG